jgi:hypothetical protein
MFNDVQLESDIENSFIAPVSVVHSLTDSLMDSLMGVLMDPLIGHFLIASGDPI